MTRLLNILGLKNTSSALNDLTLLKLIRVNIKAIFFVFAAFFIMVVLSYVFTSRIVRNHLLSEAAEDIRITELNIASILHEPEVSLANAAFTLEDMLNNNSRNEEILLYLTKISNWMTNNRDRISGFKGIYGFINGNLVNGLGWVAPENYVPIKRPWYTAALKENGQTAITLPYINEQNGKPVISYSRTIASRENDSRNVIALDIDMTKLTDYIKAVKLTQGSYKIIVNSNFEIIDHRDEKLTGKKLSDVNTDYQKIINQLKMGFDIEAMIIEDIDHTKVVVFFKKIFNGWYLGLITPATAYYSDVYRMAIVLSILGLALMTILIAILIRINVAKMTSDEENRTKSSFLARISHEIRTPMNAIIGISDIAQREKDIIKIGEHLMDIRHAGANLLALINDILDFSKIESGKLEIQQSPYQLSSLINDILSIVRLRIIEKYLLFTVDIDPKLPSELIGDSARIRQIILNLLGNSVKYTKEGSITIKIFGEQKENEKFFLNFIVKDTGIGIKTEDLDKLFTEFSQLDTHRNTGIEGSGLGLAIAMNLSKIMAGQLKVSSTYEVGSTFTLTLPQIIKDDRPLAELDTPENTSAIVYDKRKLYAESVGKTIRALGGKCQEVYSDLEFRSYFLTLEPNFIFAGKTVFDYVLSELKKAGKESCLVLLENYGETLASPQIKSISMPAQTISIATILNGHSDIKGYTEKSDSNNSNLFQFTAPEARVLVVDDINTNIKVAVGLMAPYKMRTEFCTSGPEAIEMVKNRQYDIIFMDHMMPKMDGIEATAIIRSLSINGASEIPIIALTANAVSGMKEMFLSSGFSDFLSKPIEINKLNHILEKWIPASKKRSAEENTHVLQQNNTDINLIITGIDTKVGLQNTGGVLNNYFKILKSYVQDASTRLSYLKHTNYSDDIKLFTTQVHALKSASAVIGAKELSNDASILEEAGKNNSLDTIAQKLPNFITALNNITSDISTVLSAKNSNLENQPETTYLNHETIIIFEKLKTALEAKKIQEIDSILSELDSLDLDAKTKTTIDEISDLILVAEFSQAFEVLSKLI